MAPRRSKKSERERRVLLGLVELFLKEGKPIGSNTLRESGFEDLSAATIRNYFASLESQGYLHQAHVSGGREPTAEAYRLYAEEQLGSGVLEPSDEVRLEELGTESKEVNAYLQRGAELLSELSGCAVFLSSPRFDHDLVLDVKVVPLGDERVLCVMLTDFGSVLTEVLHGEVDETLAKKLEGYFAWRVTGQEQPTLTREESILAQRLYNELMVRYVTRYSSFSEEEIYRTGFSRLLDYPEFGEPKALAGGLSLFENSQKMAKLLRDTERVREMRCYIGEQLKNYAPAATKCAVVAMPYVIQGVPVGAVGLLGPMRLPYRHLFGLLEAFSRSISESLSQSLTRFKIHYRQPQPDQVYLEETDQRLIEDQR